MIEAFKWNIYTHQFDRIVVPVLSVVKFEESPIPFYPTQAYLCDDDLVYVEETLDEILMGAYDIVEIEENED